MPTDDNTTLRLAAQQWVRDHRADWSAWASTIFDFGETAWREYRSAAWYVDLLRGEGFDVEVGSGGMPTAFCATWSNGAGPTVLTYAEYDAVPGNCQAPVTHRAPRPGLSRFAGGHTDPHSSLGIGSLAGTLAAKHVMQQHGIGGTLRLMGEPAEKVRGSKPIHAARGYYSNVDAVLSWHPFYMLPYCNTCRWDTHCGAYYGVIYEFLCDSPETWLADSDSPIAAAHTAARAPGANDAVVAMYSLSKMMRDHMLPHTGTWTINEVILASGQATADNLAAQMAKVMYSMRAPSLEMLDRALAVLDNNAAAAAAAAHCTVRRHWVAKSAPGLANHAMTRIAYRNLELGGPPQWGADAIAVAHEIQRELGLEVIDRPFIDEIEQLLEPEEAERRVRAQLPSWQTHYTSDDYTDMTWFAPSVRMYIGRPALRGPAGFTYPDWAMNALGGIPATINPTIECAARTVGATIVDLLTDPEGLAEARREFEQRTGGGVGGTDWLAPLCDYDPPIHHPWPEYVTTARGYEWWIPADDVDRSLEQR
ncbi:MAG: amidohydrolase [Ilumatobacteraceae bacterium]